jgi:hypothetical protein
MAQWLKKHTGLLRRIVGLDDARLVDRVLGYIWISVIFALLPALLPYWELFVFILALAPISLFAGWRSRYWINILLSSPVAYLFSREVWTTLTSATSTQTEFIVWLPYYEYLSAASLSNIIVSVIRIRSSQPPRPARTEPRTPPDPRPAPQ